MKLLQNISVRVKLFVVLVGTLTVALVLAWISFTAEHLFSSRDRAVRQLFALAEMAGQNSRAALAFDDRRTAIETLSFFSATRACRRLCLQQGRKRFCMLPFDCSRSASGRRTQDWRVHGFEDELARSGPSDSSGKGA